MKSFVFFIVKILLLVVFIAAILDFAYTYAYTKVINTSKFQYIKNQTGKKIDCIFYGSSRVVNSINPKVLDSCLSKNTANFGVVDARPRDILTMLKLSNHYKIKSDSIFIQTDYYYNSTEKSSFLYLDLLPYIWENDIIKEYYSDENDFIGLYYFPFYRYCRTDAKLGIRELLASLRRENEFEKTKGFVALDGYGNTWQRVLPNYIEKNKYDKEIIALLNQTKSDFMFYIAPLRSDTKNKNFVSLLKKEYAEFWDFSTAVKEDKKFLDGYHLNATGSKDFSILFANKIKEK